jgi:hypothetical protein
MTEYCHASVLQLWEEEGGLNYDPEIRHTRDLLIPATRRSILIEESKEGNRYMLSRSTGLRAREWMLKEFNKVSWHS